MKNRSVLFLLLFLMLFFATVVVGLPQKKTLKKVVLQLKWRHQFQFAGYYAAIEKGYYVQAGLDVTVREASPGIDFVRTVVQGEAHFGVGTTTLLQQRQKGYKIVLLAAIFQNSPYALFTLKRKKLLTPQSLIGKRVSFSLLSSEIHAMFVHEGIPIKHLRLKKFTWNLSDLYQNKVDALGAYITDAPFWLEKRGIKFNTIKPVVYGIDFYGDCLFTMEKTIKKDPDLVRRFRNASLKGWEYAMSHHEEIIDLIIKKYKCSKSRELLLFEANTMERLMYPGIVEIGHINLSRWQRIMSVYKKLGLLKENFSLDGFLYNPNSSSRDGKISHKLFVVAGFIIIIVFLILLFLFLFNRQLKHRVRVRTEALSAKEEQLQLALEASELAFWEWNPKTNISYFSPRYYTMLGYADKSFPMTFNSWKRLLHPDDREMLIPHFQNSLNDHKVFRLEFRMKKKDGSWAWIRSYARLFNSNKNDGMKRMVGTHMDITESRDKSMQLEESLHEKDVLLKEIHHRVKNNMQIMSSLLNLQADEFDDKGIKECFLKSIGRIRSMAAVHDQLYRSVDFSKINFKTFITSLVHNVLSTITFDSEQIEFINNSDGIFLSISHAIPLGIIINELVTNAVKHAFTPEESGLIEIALTMDSNGEYELVVSDNGKGFSEGFDPRKNDSLGISLVCMLIEQIEGELFIERGEGSRFRILFS